MFDNRSWKKLLVILVGITIVGLASEGYAQPPRGRGGIGHPVPHRGKVVRRPPAGHRAVRHRGRTFFYHRGAFYQRHPPGYIVVKAPVGAVVAAIPIGFVTFVVGGHDYYYYGGVYYQRVPSGYVVVEAPRQSVIVKQTPSPRAGESVTVTAPLLNVRSGPGKNHPVIHQVRQGDRLLIQGHAPGWFYVKLPWGEFGWVMTEFTDQLLSDANG
jgi:hypothetical protein